MRRVESREERAGVAEAVERSKRVECERELLQLSRRLTQRHGEFLELSAAEVCGASAVQLIVVEHSCGEEGVSGSLGAPVRALVQILRAEREDLLRRLYLSISCVHIFSRTEE